MAALAQWSVNLTKKNNEKYKDQADCERFHRFVSIDIQVYSLIKSLRSAIPFYDSSSFLSIYPICDSIVFRFFFLIQKSADIIRKE